MTEEMMKGFVPNNAEYVSNQPHVTVEAPAFFNPLLGKLWFEVAKKETKPFNVLSRPLPKILDVPKDGLFQVPTVKVYK